MEGMGEHEVCSLFLRAELQSVTLQLGVNLLSRCLFQFSIEVHTAATADFQLSFPILESSFLYRHCVAAFCDLNRRRVSDEATIDFDVSTRGVGL